MGRRRQCFIGLLWLSLDKFLRPSESDCIRSLGQVGDYSPKCCPRRSPLLVRRPRAGHSGARYVLWFPFPLAEPLLTNRRAPEPHNCQTDLRAVHFRSIIPGDLDRERSSRIGSPEKSIANKMFFSVILVPA